VPCGEPKGGDNGLRQTDDGRRKTVKSDSGEGADEDKKAGRARKARRRGSLGLEDWKAIQYLCRRRRTAVQTVAQKEQRRDGYGTGRPDQADAFSTANYEATM
jgi:hypothetical protein